MRDAVVRACRCRRGGTVVEFAIVVMPLLFLVFAVLEIGLIFVANASLANATLALARQIRVGTVLAAGKSITTSNGRQLDLADFKTAVCRSMSLVPSATCFNQLQVDLRTQSSFQSQTSPATGSGSNFDTSNLCFYSGAAGDIVIFRAFYLWTLQTPLILTPLATVKSVNGSATSGSFVLQAAEVFRNEPTSTSSNNGSGC